VARAANPRAFPTGERAKARGLAPFGRRTDSQAKGKAMRKAVRTSVVLSIVLLAGCSQGTPSETPEAAVPALPAGRPAIYEAAALGPEPFVRALYDVYVSGGPTDEDPALGRDPIYSRLLNAAIITDFNLARGEVPTLNYDPICACQDQGAFTLDALNVTVTDEYNALASVTFTNAGASTSQTLKLVREGPLWRVLDVIAEDDTSLNETLIRSIQARGG